MIPLGEEDNIKFDAFIKRLDRTDLSVLSLYLVGSATIDDEGVSMASESFPWGEDATKQMRPGTHDLKVKLEGEWDKEKGTQRPSFFVSECQPIDLSEGYVINKDSGAFDVRQ